MPRARLRVLSALAGIMEVMALPKFARLSEAPDWVQNYYRLRLDIEFRSVSGMGFQRLFDKVMRSIHGHNYQETATLGTRGDMGCDGYLKSRRIVFACYGPDPYFKVDVAESKMRADLVLALNRWHIPDQMREWIFVINYPAKPPGLLQTVNSLTQEHNALTIQIWSRQDVLEQFLLWARRSTLISQFGDVSVQARATGRAYVVPEGTDLPRRPASLMADVIRARVTCDRHALEDRRNRWFEVVAEEPWDCFVVALQFLVGAIAAPTMAGYLDPERIQVSRLLHEAEMSRRGWREHGERAWQLAMFVINSAGGDEVDGPPARPVRDPIGEDYDKLIGTIAAADRLAHGLIRMYSRESGDLETACLDDVWHYVIEIPYRDDLGGERSKP